MGILTKEVEVLASGKSIQYYKDKGYDAKWRKPLFVKVEDLPLRSDVLIETQCDYCGKIKPLIKYSDYNTQTKNGTKKCCCLVCASIKREESMIEKYGYGYAMQNPEMKNKIQKTNIEKYGSVSPAGNSKVREKQKETLVRKYGVENPVYSKEIQEKMKKTFLEKYGVENPLLSQEIKEKIKATNLIRYGVEKSLLNEEIRRKCEETLINNYGTLYPLQNKNCIEKLKNTNMEKYGVENVSQLSEIRQKVKQTNLEKYGYENPMQSPDFLEKWFNKNGSNFVKSSMQQRYLCNLYNGILNYPFKCFALDIYLPEDLLNIEFDGSGHRMSVSIGTIKEEDFEKKELYRNIAIKKAGCNQMRIISTKDLLPFDNVLLQMLEYAKQYFSNYPNHSWIEFNIDTSTVRNAEQKDGVFFNYGELRRIKKSDIQNEEYVEAVNCA